MRFLEISHQVFLLRPLLEAVTARLVKSPKLYWTDPALARLLGEQAGAANGALFETAVLDELLRWSAWQPEPPSLHFFRTHAGREVDFVLHTADRLIAIEAKATQRPHRTDAPSPRCWAPWPAAASAATPSASAWSSRVAARWNPSPPACGRFPTGACSGRRGEG